MVVLEVRDGQKGSEGNIGNRRGFRNILRNGIDKLGIYWKW